MHLKAAKAEKKNARGIKLALTSNSAFRFKIPYKQTLT